MEGSKATKTDWADPLVSVTVRLRASLVRQLDASLTEGRKEAKSRSDLIANACAAFLTEGNTSEGYEYGDDPF